MGTGVMTTLTTMIDDDDRRQLREEDVVDEPGLGEIGVAMMRRAS